jgi:hypothetical protein
MVGVLLLGRRRGTLRRRRAPRPQPGPLLWTCVCGARLRTVGSGRHQVHWRADALESDPLLEDRCPECERPLSLQADAVAHRDAAS